MIKVSFLYPYRENGRFDVDYYCNQHMPFAAARLGDAVKGWSVDAGIASVAPGSPPPYVAVGHVLVESVEAFQKALAPVARELQGDLVNYSDGPAPTIQISEIRVSR
jgi:uncharacterized protein (TIGR02118 family)